MKLVHWPLMDGLLHFVQRRHIISQARIETPTRKGGQLSWIFVANLLKYLCAKIDKHFLNLWTNIEWHVFYGRRRFFMVDGVYTWECKRNWDWEADCQSFTPTINFFTHKLIEVQNGIRFLWKMPVGPSYLIWSRPYLEETIRWIIQTVKSSGLRTLAFFNVFYNFWQIFQPICHFVSEVTVHKKRCYDGSQTACLFGQDC